MRTNNSWPNWLSGRRPTTNRLWGSATSRATSILVIHTLYICTVHYTERCYSTNTQWIYNVCVYPINIYTRTILCATHGVSHIRFTYSVRVLSWVPAAEAVLEALIESNLCQNLRKPRKSNFVYTPSSPTVAGWLVGVAYACIRTGNTWRLKRVKNE